MKIEPRSGPEFEFRYMCRVRGAAAGILRRIALLNLLIGPAQLAFGTYNFILVADLKGSFFPGMVGAGQAGLGFMTTVIGLTLLVVGRRLYVAQAIKFQFAITLFACLQIAICWLPVVPPPLDGWGWQLGMVVIGVYGWITGWRLLELCDRVDAWPDEAVRIVPPAPAEPDEEMEVEPGWDEVDKR